MAGCRRELIGIIDPGRSRGGAVRRRNCFADRPDDRATTVNIGQAAAGLALALIGLALVLATPKLERIARRFASSGIRPPTTTFYTPWRWWARIVGVLWIAIGLFLTLQATVHWLTEVR